MPSLGTDTRRLNPYFYPLSVCLVGRKAMVVGGGKQAFKEISRLVDFGAFVGVLPNQDGLLHISEIAHERVNNVMDYLKEGDEIEAVIVNVDRKTRNINLSVKAKDAADEKDAMKKMADDAPNNAGTTNLGALLKAKLKQGENN